MECENIVFPEVMHNKLNSVRFCSDKKQVIYRVHEEAMGFYYVYSGIVGLYRITETGKEHLIRVYGEGDYFGYRSLFSNEPYHLTTRSLLPAEVDHIQVKSADELLVKSPGLLTHLVTSVCHELGEAESRLSDIAAFESRVRVVDAIVSLFGRFGHYPWTSREVAEFSGTETQTVIRICRTLKQLSLLEPDVRGIRPRDIQKLKEFRAELVS